MAAVEHCNEAAASSSSERDGVEVSVLSGCDVLEIKLAAQIIVLGHSKVRHVNSGSRLIMPAAVSAVSFVACTAAPKAPVSSGSIVVLWLKSLVKRFPREIVLRLIESCL